MTNAAAARAVNRTRTPYLSAFLGLMLRDLRVLGRELGPFVVRIVMQPLLFLFVFTYVFPHMGHGDPMAAGAGNFATILLPGLMAVAIMFSGIAAVALPLSQEFGITREIDDRVMCPLPVTAVAVEKMCFSALQSILAALLVIPLAYFIPAVPVKPQVENWPLLILVLVLSSLVSSALGLAIGANIKPQQIGLIFSIVVVPITFLGLRLLSLGLSESPAVVADGGAAQPYRVHERGFARGPDAGHSPHAGAAYHFRPAGVTHHFGRNWYPRFP